MRAIALILVLTGAMPSLATTVAPMTQAELECAADIVVEGVVVDAESRWVKQRIITFYTVISGSALAPTSTLVAVPGGVVGDIAQVVPGAPQLERGRRYRLYLGAAAGPRRVAQGPASRGVVGFWRGVLVIDEDGAALPLGEDGRAPMVPAAVTP